MSSLHLRDDILRIVTVGIIFDVQYLERAVCFWVVLEEVPGRQVLHFQLPFLCITAVSMPASTSKSSHWDCRIYSKIFFPGHEHLRLMVDWTLSDRLIETSRFDDCCHVFQYVLKMRMNNQWYLAIPAEQQYSVVFMHVTIILWRHWWTFELANSSKCLIQVHWCKVRPWTVCDFLTLSLQGLHLWFIFRDAPVGCKTKFRGCIVPEKGTISLPGLHDDESSWKTHSSARPILSIVMMKNKDAISPRPPSNMLILTERNHWISSVASVTCKEHSRVESCLYYEQFSHCPWRHGKSAVWWNTSRY